jgi:DNA-binding transcriptional regulator YbjK
MTAGHAATAGAEPARSYAIVSSAVDWEARYDFDALRHKRVGRARAALAADDLDAVLVWKAENVR